MGFEKMGQKLRYGGRNLLCDLFFLFSGKHRETKFPFAGTVLPIANPFSITDFANSSNMKKI